MLMHSRRSVTRFGGIGVTTPTVGDGTMAGDGIVLTMAGDITRVHGAAGMVAGGDITITIIPDIIPVEDTGVGDIGHVIRIRTVVLREQAVTAILLQQSVGQVQV